MIINNLTDYIELEYPTKTISLKKDLVSFTMDTRLGCIYAHVPIFNDPNGRGSYTIKYADVTSPVTANIQSLMAVLQTYAITGDTILYSRTFTNADLVLNVLTTTHNKNGHTTMVTVVNPSGTSVLKTFTEVSVNQITVDFGGAIAAGTWTQYVFIQPV